MLAPKGSMQIDAWLQHVLRKQQNYHDFFDAAALFHFGYVNTTTLASQGRAAGQLGDDVDSTAQILCQFMLAPGEKFQTDPYLQPRERWDPAGFRVFVTERGIEKLSEVEHRGVDRRLLVLVSVLSALVGAVAAAFADISIK
jgi:hypothetical protein